MSRTSLDIDDELIKQAMSMTEYRTKTAVVEAGLRELVRKAKRDLLRKRLYDRHTKIWIAVICRGARPCALLRVPMGHGRTAVRPYACAESISWCAGHIGTVKFNMTSEQFWKMRHDK